MEDKKIISFDLGTGGNKASLYNLDGECLASAFVPYTTQYPHVGWHEQLPEDWWQAVIKSTHQLLEKYSTPIDEVVGLGISGHSLGAVPIDKDGNLLREQTPIWSDIRAQQEVASFFKIIDEDDWYLTTGNGFPAACYTIFKVMWYQNHEPEMFLKIDKILGTKDYINFKLTGKILTDHSYASGTGIYDLKKWRYSQKLLQVSGISAELWPEIVPSTHILGDLRPEVANEMGLSTNVKVVCGGVDNSCMALGAKNTRSGRVYTSLGSSAWIAVSSEEPVLDKIKKPYVFAHVIPGLYTSAVSIFSAGTTFNWIKNQLCHNLVQKAEEEGSDVYTLMNQEAAKAPVGSHKLLFNPSLAGGTSQDASVHIRGAFIGMDLKHEQADLIRSAMEGIAMNLRLRLNLLRHYTNLDEEILFVGGGAKSRFYLGLFADIFNCRILKSNIDQDAAALGAAAVAAVGCGLWKDFSKIDEIHKIKEIVEPNQENNAKYEKLLPIFEQAADDHSTLGNLLNQVDL
jgi:xylulokinase